MNHRSTLLSASLLFGGVVAAIALSNGCSSSSSGTAGTSAPYTAIIPPSRPSTTASGQTKWFAINNLRLGLVDKTSGKQTADAWKSYGFDLDGRNTTADDSKNSTNSCKRISGSPTAVLADGNGGIDNNFGGHIMQTVKGINEGAEDSVNQSIQKGDFTLLLKIDNFTTGDNNHAPGTIYAANNFNDGKSAPSFTTADIWKITDSSLQDGKSIDKPNSSFPNGFIANGQWVSGDFGGGTIQLQIALSGAVVTLPIQSGIVVANTNGADGTIAGAMDTAQLQSALTPVAERFGICPSDPTYTTVITTLTQSADLVSGAPSLQDTNAQCNAVSIAIGFTMTETGTPTEVQPAPTSGAGGCDDAGDTGPGDTGSGDSSDAGG